MSIATLYDVHGNLPALEAVLAEIPDDATIVVGGDVVAGGTHPSETLERLRGLGDRVVWIRGNADRELKPGRAGPRAGRTCSTATRAALTDEQIEFLYAQPLDGADRRVLFCHATPRNDLDIFTERTPEERLVEIFAGVDADVVVCGHTHMQFERSIAGKRVINSGSVGMPYEDEPGAYWTLDLEHRRTDYDGASPSERSRDDVLAHFTDTWPLTSCRSAASGGRTGSTGRSSSRARAIARAPSQSAQSSSRTASRLKIVSSKHGSQKRPVIRLERRVDRGAELAVPRESLPPLGEDEYYSFQLVGLAVEEEGGRVLGRVRDVLDYPANDVLELDTGLSLPLVEACVRKVDLESGRIVVAQGFADLP